MGSGRSGPGGRNRRSISHFKVKTEINPIAKSTKIIMIYTAWQSDITGWNIFFQICSFIPVCSSIRDFRVGDLEHVNFTTLKGLGQKKFSSRQKKVPSRQKKVPLGFRGFCTCFWEVDHPLCDV